MHSYLQPIGLLITLVVVFLVCRVLWYLDSKLK
jgi:hypothetical protein